MRKEIGIFVCMLFIATAVLPVLGTMNKNRFFEEGVNDFGYLTQQIRDKNDFEASILKSEVSGCGNTITFIPTDDSYVDPLDPNGNFNDIDRLNVGDFESFPGPTACRTYLQFDLSGIPPGSIINSAELYLFVEGYMFPFDVGVHYLNDDNWYEGQITWNLANPGFDPIPTDIKTIASGYWYDWDVTSDVQKAVDSDTILSEVLKATVEYVQDEGCSFVSKELIGYEPYLIIDYCLAGDITLNLPVGVYLSGAFDLILNNNAGQTLSNVNWQISWITIISFPPNYPPGSVGSIVTIPTTGTTVTSGTMPVLPSFFGIALIRIAATADCASSVARRGFLLWFGSVERIRIF